MAHCLLLRPGKIAIGKRKVVIVAVASSALIGSNTLIVFDEAREVRFAFRQKCLPHSLPAGIFILQREQVRVMWSSGKSPIELPHWGQRSRMPVLTSLLRFSVLAAQQHLPLPLKMKKHVVAHDAKQRKTGNAFIDRT